ncbi:DNA translocase FtsK [Salipaludibacillus daqingensis]|uniref:DNA translocase FtsK n=1 Tax=Salipaludibacillus daqingensis TaxID=3041001 RepID=UPI002476FB3A|nr:DNA translocase FtsK [Salipaludibacillus daqingensis]
MKETRLLNYFSKLKKWLFPDEDTEPLERKREDSPPLYESSKQGFRNNENYIEEHNVRMISKYPKEGSFRFPLIKDEVKEAQPSASKKTNATDDKKEIQTTVEKEKKEVNKEKFTGHRFSVREIPSPIHGYQPIHMRTASHISEKEENQNKEQKSTYVPEVSKGKVPRLTRREKSENTPVNQPSETKQNIIPFKREKEVDKSENEGEQLVKNLNEKSPSKTMKQKHAEIEKEEEKEKESPVIFMDNQMDGATDEKRISTDNQEKGNYSFPSLLLLNEPVKTEKDDKLWLSEQTEKLNETFEYFHIRAEVVRVTKGPSVTRFEVQPEPGVKVSKIVNLTDDLKLSLSAKDIRIEAPIPGKNTIGVEVPNDVAEPVFLREILEHPSFNQAESPLTVAMGMGISGDPVLTDLQKMPHGLIAGSTGSGKSVCVNSILTSIVYKASPEEVRLLLIDPKMVELAPFNDVPHLAAPVITDPKEATEGLKWAVTEMERRYQSFANAGARDIARYNEKMERAEKPEEKLPYLLIVVDELADLMMVSPQDVEDSICRIAQKARACGIHLLVATQRPSVDVITGLIKANIPTRVAFSVSSQADSRTILDAGGAERLLGRGDMLLLESGSSKPVRIQGTFVSDDEIDRVVDYVKELPTLPFLFEKEELKEKIATEAEDDLFEEACEFVLQEQAASASLLQRRFRMGYNRAARLIDVMESRGIVSSSRGSKPRDVYLTKHE